MYVFYLKILLPSQKITRYLSLKKIKEIFLKINFIFPKIIGIFFKIKVIF